MTRRSLDASRPWTAGAATVTDYYREQDRRAGELGFRPSNARACPRVVVGRRCQAHQYVHPCICETHRHLLDHARQWFDRNHHDRRVLTGEPYDVTIDELVAFAADLEPLGLTAQLIPGPGLWQELTHVIVVTETEEHPS